MGQDERASSLFVEDEQDGQWLETALAALMRRWLLLLVLPLVAGAAAFGITFLIPPTYTASTMFMPPQQSQSSGLAALASLGSVPGLGNLGSSGARNTGDQYIALMQSATVSDRIIERFKLMQVYDVDYRIDARRELSDRVRITLGKKDGMVTVDVDDTSPQRAADIANRYVEELRRMTDTIAVSEAQQRRVFFDRQLQQSRDRLTKAQQALQASGFNPDALKAEPKAAADQYARRKAEVTVAEVRLQVLRQSMTDSSPEVQAQQAALAALRSQLARLEQQTTAAEGPDYVGAYREFKYQEAQFEMMARQLEIARADESREGALIQVVDPATPPERRTRPRRMLISLATVAATLLLLTGVVVLRARRPSQAL